MPYGEGANWDGHNPGATGYAKLNSMNDGQDTGPIGLFGWIVAILARWFG